MTLGLNTLIPWQVKAGGCVAIVLLLFFGGWHYGAHDVQSQWDDANAKAIVASDNEREQQQKTADTVGQLVESEINQKEKTIGDLTKELSDATNQLGACGHQSLSNDSVQLYSRAVSAH